VSIEPLVRRNSHTPHAAVIPRAHKPEHHDLRSDQMDVGRDHRARIEWACISVCLQPEMVSGAGWGSEMNGIGDQTAARTGVDSCGD
jgi:hypothetical protein